MHVCMHACMPACLHARMYVCIYGSMYLCMHAWFDNPFMYACVVYLYGSTSLLYRCAITVLYLCGSIYGASPVWFNNPYMVVFKYVCIHACVYEWGASRWLQVSPYACMGICIFPSPSSPYPCNACSPHLVTSSAP